MVFWFNHELGISPKKCEKSLLLLRRALCEGFDVAQWGYTAFIGEYGVSATLQKELDVCIDGLEGVVCVQHTIAPKEGHKDAEKSSGTI